MSPTVTVGLDGSRESLAAADFAAREAVLRGAALHLVHVGEQPSAYVPFAGEPVARPGDDRSARMLSEIRARLTHRHTHLPVTTDQIAGHVVTGLLAAAGESELLVLGSRGLGRAAGFLFASVASAVVARAERPVALVGAHGEHPPATPPYGTAPTRRHDVVLGLGPHRPTTPSSASPWTPPPGAPPPCVSSTTGPSHRSTWTAFCVPGARSTPMST